MKEKLVLQKKPIWDRQPKETLGQFMWFTRYLEARLNGESMAAVCAKYGKKPGYAKVLSNWSYPNRWTERIEAYRDFLDQERQRQRLKDIQEMGERQAKNGVLLQQYGIAWFAAHQDIGKGDGLSPEMAMRFIETGSRIERTARGVPTEIRAEGELPEETRKRMESIYAEAMEDVGDVISANILEQKELQKEQETERG
jgi:hypothetical protein